MKKEVNPTVAIVIIALIVIVGGIFGYQRLSAPEEGSWDTMSQETKDKIGAAYGAAPKAPTQPTQGQ